MHVHFHIIPRFPDSADGAGFGRLSSPPVLIYMRELCLTRRPYIWQQSTGIPAGTLENEAGQRLATDIAAALAEE